MEWPISARYEAMVAMVSNTKYGMEDGAGQLIANCGRILAIEVKRARKRTTSYACRGKN